MQINENVSKDFWARLKTYADKLAKAGYKGVHLNTTLQMVIGEEKIAAHQRFYPTEPLIFVTPDNCPTSIKAIKDMFRDHPIYPAKTDEQKAADLAAILDEAETEIAKPKKTKTENK
jgi:hypothetical protein